MVGQVVFPWMEENGASEKSGFSMIFCSSTGVASTALVLWRRFWIDTNHMGDDPPNF